MAFSESPQILLALIEDEASPADIWAQRAQIFDELLALFAPDYAEPPYTVKALSHLAYLLERWRAATSGEARRLHQRAGMELKRIEASHECIVCTSPKLRERYKRSVTDADLVACPITEVITRYGLVDMRHIHHGPTPTG